MGEVSLCLVFNRHSVGYPIDGGDICKFHVIVMARIDTNCFNGIRYTVSLEILMEAIMSCTLLCTPPIVKNAM